MPGGGSRDAEQQHGIMPPQQLTFCRVLLVMQLEDIGARVFFEKQLTSSDVSASGRVVVPKVSRCQQRHTTL
jgi:hypothetical protein